MPLSIIKSHTLCKISSFSQTINNCSLFSSANFEKFIHVLSIQSSRDFLLMLKASHFNKKCTSSSISPDELLRHVRLGLGIFFLTAKLYIQSVTWNSQSGQAPSICKVKVSKEIRLWAKFCFKFTIGTEFSCRAFYYLISSRTNIMFSNTILAECFESNVFDTG